MSVIQHILVEQGNHHQEEQAVITQGIPVNLPPSSDAQGHQHQPLHQPPDINDATHSPSEEDSFECRWLQQDGKSPCGQRFPDRMEVVKHLNHVHGVNGTAKCKITCRWLPRNTSGVCNRQIRRSSVSRHVNIHLGQTFSCSYLGCRKSYSRRDSLKKHMKTHSS